MDLAMVSKRDTPPSPAHRLFLLLIVACLSPILPGTKPCQAASFTLAIPELPDTLHAGTSPCLWLTALNLTDTPARWNPPEEIVCRLICVSNTVEVPIHRTGRTGRQP